LAELLIAKTILSPSRQSIACATALRAALVDVENDVGRRLGIDISAQHFLYRHKRRQGVI
jgi:hypothetical protein